MIYRIGRQEDIFFVIRMGLWESIIFGSLSAPASIYALLLAMKTGSTPSLGECFAWGVRKWLRTFGYQLLTWFVVGIGFILLIVPGVIAWTMLAFTDQVIAVEGPGTNVIERSRRLTAGIRLRLFAAMLIAGFVFIVPALLVTVPLSWIDNWWLSAITESLSVPLVPIFYCILVVAYLDARRRQVS
ncbi:MAG TPA: hypothetical protein VM056_03895 [Terriglobales bacterium]|nr:hypothetical protein [Terriglobales bacterium]